MERGRRLFRKKMSSTAKDVKKMLLLIGFVYEKLPLSPYSDGEVGSVN